MSRKPTRNWMGGLRWRGLVASLTIWSFWVVLPAALLKPSSTQAFAAGQFGNASLAYLGGAPPALCGYLVLAQSVMLPALIALAWTLPARREETRSGAQAWRYWLATLLPFLGWWAAVYWGGDLLMACLELHRGTDALVVRGFAFYLGVYGFVATLPQWGFVFAFRTLIRRTWLSMVASVTTSAIVATLALVLQARGFTWSTPVLLRSELFSGHADTVSRATWGFLMWGFVLATAALGVAMLRACSPDRLLSRD